MFARKVHVLQIEVSYRNEGFFRPSKEPINRSVGNQSWEVSAPNSESISSWRHCQDDMEIVPGLINKVVPQIFFSFLNAIPFSLIFDFITHIFLLVLIEKSRDHTDSKEIVDQFQESFFEYMCISK